MSKRLNTRAKIVDRALQLASTVGLEGLTLGELANSVKLSKSGLFAHFRSKERLQLVVLQAAAARFVDDVVVPAIRQPRGEPRVVALFERWLYWAQSAHLPGGCVFIAWASELDDRPGAVRDALAETQRQWLGTLAKAVSIAKQEGHFRGDLDETQFAFELHAIYLEFHHQHRLLNEPTAAERATRAFESLLERSRT